jgi:hypothetical protein
MRRRRRSADGKLKLIELGEQRAGIGRTLRRVLAEDPAHELVQRVGDVADEELRRHDFFEEDPREDGDGVVGREGEVPSEAAIEDAPKREDVGAGVDVLPAAHLLGRHEPWSAEHHPGLRELGPPAGLTDDPEVEDLHLSEISAHEEEIRRLDVAVNEAPRMREGEPLCRVLHDRDTLGEVQAARVQQVTEVVPHEPFHR